MDNYQDMQKFINANSEYLKNRGESYASDLQRHLQIIASASSVDTFDPTVPVVTQFYANLHELLSILDSRSMLVWSAISVLQKACSNPAAKSTLVHTYKFVPVLTKFLNVDQMSDKQLRLFQVLKEVTYGVKIAWEEAHLPHLVSILVQIILNENNDLKELKPLAFEVLVNLCYDNLPVLYVLMGKVDLTKFIMHVSKLNENPLMRIHVCKMFIVFQQVKGNLPERDILNFVDVIFNTATEALQSRDSNLLRQIVDLFKDIRENHHFYTVASRYDKYYEDIKNVIQVIDQGNGEEIGECLPLVLEFLYSSFFMNFQKNKSLILTLLNMAGSHLYCETATLSCLKIMRMIAELETTEVSPIGQDSVLEKLSECLPSIVGLLENSEVNSLIISPEKNRQLTSLAALLTVMANNAELRKQILSSVNCDSIRDIFQSVFKYHTTDQRTVFRPDNGELCVKLLLLVSKLANYKADWMSFSSELLSNRHILMELALTFADGDKIVKYEVLRLAGNNGWSKDSLITLCDMMTSLKNTGIVDKRPENSPQKWSPRETVPTFSRTQETRLDELLEALNKLKEEGKLADVQTSSVMDIYEYKLVGMGQAERRLQAALEASDSLCIRLNHQLVQIRSEVLRVHQLLFSYQLSIEGAKKEKTSLMEKQKTIKEHAAAEKAQLSRLVSDLKSQIQQFEKKLADREVEYENALQKMRGECEGRVSKLSSEVEELQSALAESIKISQQKDLHILECNKQIDDLERIREMVVNVAAKKEKIGF